MQELDQLAAQVKKACQKIKTLEDENLKLRQRLAGFEDELKRVSHLGPQIRKVEEANLRVKKRLTVFRDKIEKLIETYESGSGL